MALSESEFNAAAEKVLASIEAALERVAADIEASRSGNVLTIELGNGSRVVVNTQAAMQQVWVAAKSGGFHYAWTEGAWRDTRDGSELFAALSRVVSQQGGEAVVLRP